jgi:uncharacterized protein (TIGR03790 family)
MLELRRATSARASAALGLASLLLPTACAAERHPEVLVVANGASPISVAIGARYAETRRVPTENVIALTIPIPDPSLADDSHETISREAFDEKLRKPLEAILIERDLVDTIEVIVTTKGVPLRVDGADSPMKTLLRDSTRSSVDAELSLLFSDRIGSAGVSESANPFFDSGESFREFRRAHPGSPLRYMVARLTGYPDEHGAETSIPRDVQALIDRGVEPLGASRIKAGRWLIDGDPSQDEAKQSGNVSLLNPAASALRALGLEIQFDENEIFVSGAESIQGYASWGSNDRLNPGKPFYGEIDGRLYPGSFAPRAVVVGFVSSDARSFGPPHYGQSLVADLIRLGAAGSTGHVYEPMLTGVPRPHILLPAYAQGLRAVEAFYRSLPYLGWTNVYIGDPLMTIARPSPARNSDRDNDGVDDSVDNCSAIPNPEQRDTNGDGFGNLCDADVDGDGIVTTSWGEVLPLTRCGDVEWIGLAVQHGRYDPNYDLDGDGRVDDLDVAIAALNLFLAPGPSGLARTRGR